jgi:hypothetical protein
MIGGWSGRGDDEMTGGGCGGVKRGLESGGWAF